MRRKLISLVAAVLALTMIIGATAFATKSPTPTTAKAAAQSTSSDSGSSTSSSSTVEVPQEVVIPRGAGFMQAGEVRATSGYSGVTDNTMIATIYKNPANDIYSQVMNEFAKTLPGIKLGAYKLRMYKSGVSIWDGFGVFNVALGVGNAYDGRTATVYIIHKLGNVETQTVPVIAGKVNISLTEMGTVLIQIN